MGKVVRSATIENGKYLVPIPAIDVGVYREHVTELDERFAAPLRSLSDLPDAAREPVPIPVAPTIDWQALQVQADAMIERASLDAQGLLHDAAAHANELIASARANVENLEEAARRTGHERGSEAGREDVASEMSEMVTTLRGLITSARDERHTVIEGAESELVTLAMAIAEHVVHQHIAVEPSVVLENVRGALTRLVSREVVTLRVHPADLETIREYRDSLVASNDVERLRVIEDQRVDRGGVVLETESGTLDAKIGTQLREARKALHADETIALVPSGEQGVLHSSAQAS